MGWVRDPLSSRAWEVPGRSGLQEAPGPGGGVGGRSQLPAARANLTAACAQSSAGGRSGETENNLTPQPVGRWGPDADPHLLAAPTANRSVFWGGEGHLWGLNKWAGGRGCRENRMTGRQAWPQGRRSSAEPALWPARLLWEGGKVPQPQSRAHLSLGSH